MAVRDDFTAGEVLAAADLNDTFASKGDINSNGAWTTWTPTFTNFTLGNGTVTAKYVQIGKFVACRITILLGSTSSFSGAISLSVPVTAVEMGSIPAIGTVTYLDAGTASYPGHIRQDGANGVSLTVFVTSGTYGSEAGVGASVPFTWANTDVINGTFLYEAA